MKLKIEYSKEAIKFLNKNPSVITIERVKAFVISGAKKILKIEENNIDLKRLKGVYKGLYRIRAGKIRIIFTLRENEIHIASVQNIIFRSNAYK